MLNNSISDTVKQVWRAVCVVDVLACVGLFFLMGFADEIKYLKQEAKDAPSHQWDDDTVDLAGLSAARALVMWLVLSAWEGTLSWA